MSDSLHVRPVGDLTGHGWDDCPCGPRAELVETAHGDEWLMVHHSLDGREKREVPGEGYREAGDLP